MALGTILLLYDGSESADALLRLACQMIDARGRLIALYTTRIPASLPLDPLPTWIDQDGNEALDRAEAVASARNVAIETRLTRVRRPVDAIIAEARECEATAIFLPQPSWRWPVRRVRAMFTARSVPRRTACPVLVGSWREAAGHPRWHDAADGTWRHSTGVFGRARDAPRQRVLWDGRAPGQALMVSFWNEQDARRVAAENRESLGG